MNKHPDQNLGEYLFRSMETKDDFKFVWKTWLRDYSHRRNPWAGSFPRATTFEATKKTITDLLQEDNVYVVIACPANDRDQIYGFVCFERTEAFPVLHYVYVKAAFRNHKIGSHLKAIAQGTHEGVMRYTFRTPICNKFLSGCKHNWNLIRGRKQEENE